MRAVIAYVVSCALVIGCSGSDSTVTPPPVQTIMPPTTAGTPAAGAPAAGAPGQQTSRAGSSAGGGAGSAGARMPTMPMPMAGTGADDADAGMPPPTDAGAMMPTDGAVTQPPARTDPGKGDGTDVITIGDSWMNLGSTGIQQSLRRASGQPYRTYGRGGTRLLNEAIPNQYANAKRADPDIKTVVMTGGGNDIIQVPGLRDDCDRMGMMCAMVVTQILDRLTKLWDEMAADGVQDVVYVQYSNPEGNNVDFAQANGDGVKKRCEAVKPPLRCHRLETLDIVMGDIPDGIHPSGAAYDRIGKAVFDLMVAQGMRR